MKRWIRLLHRWTGLLLAAQFVLWMSSGVVMSLLDQAAVEGQAHQAEPTTSPKPWPSGLRSPVQIAVAVGSPLHSLEATWLLDRPVYRWMTESAAGLVDASSGRPLPIDAIAALALAKLDYIGEGTPGTPERLAKATLEVRGHQGPIWRVPFVDADDTTLYVSAQDGKILERRNRHWRLFDVFWMLHIMDYTGRKNFNNPLVVMAAFAGVWIALSGIWLLVASLRFRVLKPR